jgi:hypothetical protein
MITLALPEIVYLKKVLLLPALPVARIEVM